jgi:hypothetical protein
MGWGRPGQPIETEINIILWHPMFSFPICWFSEAPHKAFTVEMTKTMYMKSIVVSHSHFYFSFLGPSVHARIAPQAIPKSVSDTSERTSRTGSAARSQMTTSSQRFIERLGAESLNGHLSSG